MKFHIFTFTESVHDAMKMCPLENDRWKCQISLTGQDTTAWATDTFCNMHSSDCYAKKHYRINSHWILRYKNGNLYKPLKDTLHPQLNT